MSTSSPDAIKTLATSGRAIVRESFIKPLYSAAPAACNA
jgi:hypothetical protein